MNRGARYNFIFATFLDDDEIIFIEIIFEFNCNLFSLKSTLMFSCNLINLILFKFLINNFQKNGCV